MAEVYFKPAEDYIDSAGKLFEEQKLRLAPLLPGAEIEHIGSTSIPGLLTKGDLDINIRVAREDFEQAIGVLQQFYEVNQPENWNESFASFKDDHSFPLDFGAQLTVIGSELDDFVNLRDKLKSDGELLAAYNAMKSKYQGSSMDEYREAKAEFFYKLRN